jgi:hypothetical protein
MSPSTLSAAVAPGSVNVPPAVTLVEFPIKVMVEHYLLQLLLILAAAALPAASLTL